MKKTIELLDKEIEEKAEELKHIESCSEEYKPAVEAFAKLIEKKAELIMHEEEKDYKKTKKLLDVIDLVARHSLTLVGIAVTAILTVWGTKLSINFEEHGTMTTTAGREFLKKLFHFK